jgi:hypothetical protein
MEKIENTISHPGIGAGVPIAGAGIAEACADLIPILSFISLSLGIVIGILSLYFNVKKIIKERKR